MWRRSCARNMNPEAREIATNVARVFAEHFTEQELKQLTAFYKTPLGQKLVKEEPAGDPGNLQTDPEMGGAVFRNRHGALPLRDAKRRDTDLSAGDHRQVGSVRHRCRLRRGTGGPGRGPTWRAGHDRRGVSGRRHLRDPWLRAEKASCLCVALRPRVRGRGGIRLEAAAAGLRLADPHRQQGPRDRATRGCLYCQSRKGRGRDRGVRAVIEDPNTVRLLATGARLRAGRILIATGGAPFAGTAFRASNTRSRPTKHSTSRRCRARSWSRAAAISRSSSPVFSPVSGRK